MNTSSRARQWLRTSRHRPGEGGFARKDVTRVASALITAGTAAAAVVALAMPAGASTGTAQISPDQAGYIATGAAMPAHWWQAEGNAKDSAGTDNGRLVGAGFGPGVLGPDQAFSFAGEGQKVVFNKSGGNLGRGDFTLAFDIKTTATVMPVGVWGKRIACNTDGTPFWEFSMVGSPQLAGAITFGYGTPPAENPNATSTTSINDGKWHQVAATRHGRTVKLYIDGTLEATATSASTLNLSNTSPMRAGVSTCDGIDGTHPFTGELDELMIFRTAFTQQQIQALRS